MNSDNHKPVIELWENALKEKTYKPPAIGRWSRKNFEYLSRSWRRILKHTGIKRTDNIRALEFGSGEGHKLIPLYIKGWDCVGIDCSEDATHRAKQYLIGVDKYFSDTGNIELKTMDFLKYEPPGDLFDITFQFGVLEHFLDETERKKYLIKMFDCTRPGGFVVSWVPNGCHFYREKQREKKLGGYNIPEIDYTEEKIRSELEEFGCSSIVVLPYDLFGYLNIIPASIPLKVFFKMIYLFFQLPVFQFLPKKLLLTHSYSFLAIAQKI
ncbi:class I SAM-dependent methyltransferase [Candidatus Latescibacterota bacterium]